MTTRSKKATTKKTETQEIAIRDLTPATPEVTEVPVRDLTPEVPATPEVTETPEVPVVNIDDLYKDVMEKFKTGQEIAKSLIKAYHDMHGNTERFRLLQAFVPDLDIDAIHAYISDLVGNIDNKYTQSEGTILTEMPIRRPHVACEYKVQGTMEIDIGTSIEFLGHRNLDQEMKRLAENQEYTRMVDVANDIQKHNAKVDAEILPAWYMEKESFRRQYETLVSLENAIANLRERRNQTIAGLVQECKAIVDSHRVKYMKVISQAERKHVVVEIPDPNYDVAMSLDGTFYRVRPETIVEDPGDTVHPDPNNHHNSMPRSLSGAGDHAQNLHAVDLAIRHKLEAGVKGAVESDYSLAGIYTGMHNAHPNGYLPVILEYKRGSAKRHVMLITDQQGQVLWDHKWHQAIPESVAIKCGRVYGFKTLSIAMRQTRIEGGSYKDPKQSRGQIEDICIAINNWQPGVPVQSLVDKKLPY